MSFDLVIFGGTGDLCFRKLMPALFQAFRHGALDRQGRILGCSRTAMATADYHTWLAEKFRTLSWDEPYSEEELTSFMACVEYQTFSAHTATDYLSIRDWLGKRSAGSTPQIFYLAIAPDLFTTICDGLASLGLNSPSARVVLEKPLGRDLASAVAINQSVRQHYAEHQIFRIDHYLGKQSVQNLLALRFGNIFFEPLWRREFIASVQITLAEELGVENRGSYYDNAGALRDMVQNHLLQLLCFVAMEPPANDSADAIRDEKLKVLRCLRPLSEQAISQQVIRGQYRSGLVNGSKVAGYQEEPGVRPESHCETYIALRAEIENWRWAGVPFFLRTGKRLPTRMAEIVIQFRQAPHSIFPLFSSYPHNRLVIRLQPEDHIQLHLFAKSSNRYRAEHGRLEPVALDLDFKEEFGTHTVEAYERLLRQIIAGRLDLFVRSDEQEAAWQWVMPIINAWKQDLTPIYPYAAGSWGPSAASALMAKSGGIWSEEL
jgi:glucose-6-phosphate 1-dehydrogenase